MLLLQSKAINVSLDKSNRGWMQMFLIMQIFFLLIIIKTTFFFSFLRNSAKTGAENNQCLTFTPKNCTIPDKGILDSKGTVLISTPIHAENSKEIFR